MNETWCQQALKAWRTKKCDSLKNILKPQGGILALFEAHRAKMCGSLQTPNGGTGGDWVPPIKQTENTIQTSSYFCSEESRTKFINTFNWMIKFLKMKVLL